MPKTAPFGYAIWTLACLVIVLLSGCPSKNENSISLLNVSYDVTRELYKDLNEAFIPSYERGSHLTISQSHAGSGSQARAVIDGLDADVVTLNMWSDIHAIEQRGLIDKGWEERLPHRSLPYYSTIVFVVRKENPKNIRDWPDLVRPEVVVITPNPKTSGNGKLSFLAAWGSVVERGGTEQQAQEFVTELFRHTPVLDTGGRGATTTFSQKKIGDVHLTFENEAHMEVEESKGALQIVAPPVSIRAEPHVAVVDRNVDRKGTREAAEAYLKFLYSDEAQEIIARHFLRPSDPEVLAKHSDRFPSLKLFDITAIAPSWEAAQARFFAEGGVFDAIYQPGVPEKKSP